MISLTYIHEILSTLKYLAIMNCLLEEIIQKKVRKVMILFKGFFNVSKKTAVMNAEYKYSIISKYDFVITYLLIIHPPRHIKAIPP